MRVLDRSGNLTLEAVTTIIGGRASERRYVVFEYEGETIVQRQKTVFSSAFEDVARRRFERERDERLAKAAQAAALGRRRAG